MDKEANDIMGKYDQKEKERLKTLKVPNLPNTAIGPHRPRLFIVCSRYSRRKMRP